jgi:outer membrane protein TolC
VRFHRSTLAISLAFALGGCATISPETLQPDEVINTTQADSTAMIKDVEPLPAALSMDEAIARALKYNLDRRTRMMEESLAMGQLDVTKFDMLPKLLAQAGYMWRDTDRLSYSADSVTQTRSTSAPFISQDRIHSLKELNLNWSLLDYGMGYYSSRQQANRFLIAGEKRRKAMHLLVQDVKTAYWRAASAQLLREDVVKVIQTADEALADARKTEDERVRNPIEPLRYQRQLLENVRLLEAIQQELSTAMVDLASLINAPIGATIKIAQTDLKNISAQALEISVPKLEEIALQQNADLREQHYNARIARDETRRTLVRLFPNLNFNYGAKFDTDNYLVNQGWREASAQVSFNLLNLYTGPIQIKLAEAGVALADQKRMATQLGVITQVHLARLQLINARAQFDRAEAIYDTDNKIASLMRSRQQAQAQSKLDLVSNETAAILSLLRRYQALAQVQTAENRLIATLGLEPNIGSTNELSLSELTAQVAQSGIKWSDLQNYVPQPIPVVINNGSK